MKKIISSYIIAILIVPSFMVFPVATRAEETVLLCTPQVQSIVSDTSTQVDLHDSALLTSIHPLWTASIPGSNWIWSENPIALNPTFDTSKVFSRVFTIEQNTPIVDATLEIAVDNIYEVFVNGQSVGSDAGEWNFSTLDIITIPASALVVGPNTISFLVKNSGVADSTIETNPAGLLYKLTYSSCPIVISVNTPQSASDFSPAGGSVKKPQNLIFDWSDVTGTDSPVKYIFELSSSTATTTTGAFVSMLYGTTTPTSNSTIPDLPDGTYYWHVQVCDSSDVCSKWSDTLTIVIDSLPPVTTFASPISGADFVDTPISITGTTTDINNVASTTLEFSSFDGTSCGAFSYITTLVNPTATSSFAWSYNWTPSVVGSYCLTAHGQDVAGNIESSPVIKNIKFSKATTTPTVVAVSGGGGGGNGPVSGSFGVSGGGSSSGTGGGIGGQGGDANGNTGPQSNPAPVTPTNTVVGGNNTDGGTGNTGGTTNVVATVTGGNAAGNTGGTGFLNKDETGALTGTTTDEGSEEVLSDNSNQAASVIGTSWLTWKNGLWILGILLFIILIIWFVYRRKDDEDQNVHR